MSRVEFLEWWEFHRRSPLDDVSLHIKPIAMLAYTVAAHSPAGTKATLQSYMDSLCPVPDEDTAYAIFRSFLS